MVHVVHLRFKAAEAACAVAYRVEVTIIRENGVEEGSRVITMQRGSEDTTRGEYLWHSLAEYFPPDPEEVPGGDAGAPVLVVLRLHVPELHDLDWEGLARAAAEAGVTRPVTVLRSEVGAGNFQPGEPLPFHDLPLRVLVIGVDSSEEQGAEPAWHEDVAVHTALSAHAERWEVDVLPGPMSHDSLSGTLKDIQPHVLHLAGWAARDLLVDGSDGLSGLNLSSVRLVVSSSDATPSEAHRLIRPFVKADALHPALAAISLTLAPEHTCDACSAPERGRDLCLPVRALYRALAEGRSIAEAASDAVAGHEGCTADAKVTVNCLPDQVLPAPPVPAVDPADALDQDQDRQDLYGPLIGATDRVAQRRTALDWLESGTALKKLLVLCGNGTDGPIGTTCLMLSLLRVWEKRHGCRALYLDFRELRRSAPPRHAGASPPPAPNVIVETVALLAESIRRDSRRNGGWGVDEDLEALVAEVDGMRHDHSKGGRRAALDATRDSLLKRATDLVVKLAPPGFHLVLALDHFAVAEDVRSEARVLVSRLFDSVLQSRSAVSVVVTAEHPQGQAAEWIRCFQATRCFIELHPWPQLRASSLLRELGVQLRYDWHDKEEWQAMVVEQVGMISGDFGPKFLNDVYWAAVTQIG
ncbi:hypothetical protein ACWD3J_30465 [Streptomyces sp. NPDC002755]|uniref:hypothetical protein n=1 Tax=Streptomyces sp. NPDC002884 TaxID=3154544 RepID=UPI003333EF08